MTKEIIILIKLVLDWNKKKENNKYISRGFACILL